MRFTLRELVLVLLLVVMPVGAWMLVFRPANARIRQVRTEVAQKQNKLIRLEAATRHIDQIAREIERLDATIDRFEAGLSEREEVEAVLKETWELAVSNGLKPRSVRTDRPVKSVRYSALPLEMVIDGDFAGFYDFLLELERLDRVTRISQMNLTKLGEKGGRIEARFTLSVYFRSDESAGQMAAAIDQ